MPVPGYTFYRYVKRLFCSKTKSSKSNSEKERSSSSTDKKCKLAVYEKQREFHRLKHTIYEKSRNKRRQDILLKHRLSAPASVSLKTPVIYVQEKSSPKKNMEAKSSESNYFVNLRNSVYDFGSDFIRLSEVNNNSNCSVSSNSSCNFVTPLSSFGNLAEISSVLRKSASSFTGFIQEQTATTMVTSFTSNTLAVPSSHRRILRNSKSTEKFNKPSFSLL